MSLPLWKIKRELTRPFLQLRDLPERLGTLFFAQHYYDFVLAPKKKVAQGKIEPSNRVGIYLIFPQNGVLASHREALRYLVANGFSPVVVSNLPLTEADRSDLLQLATLIIERPNFGYDFGGYRDGVLDALKRFDQMDRLVLLNDSAWFPLPGSRNWLEAAEALQLDFVGAASNYGHPRVNPEDYRELRWNYSCDHHNFHYCSFALMLSGQILSDPRFLKFWQKFPLTNNKSVTVRRGEIGLSRWVISRGFSHGTTLDITDLDKDLEAKSHSELQQIAANTLIPEMPRAKLVKLALNPKNASREDLIGFILTSVARQGISYTQPRLMHQDRGFAFLKKSPLWLDEDASDLTLDLLRDMSRETGDPLAQTFLGEAVHLRQTRGKGFASISG